MGEVLLNSGAVTFNLLGGFVLALLLGLALLARYRQAVRRLMRATTGPAPVDDRPRHAPAASLTLKLERVPAALRLPALPTGPLGRAAMIELAAGLAFGLVAALLILHFGNLEILPLRLAAIVVAFAWPSVLVLNLLWGPDRLRQLATAGAYLSVVALLCLLSGLSSGDMVGLLAPLQLWAVYASFSLVLLLFINRAVRAVGPVLVVIAVCALFGANLAVSLLATDSGARVAVEMASSLGGGAWTALVGTGTAGLVLGAALGWVAAGALAEAHAHKRFGEQTLVADAIWLVQTLVLASSLFIEGGAPGLVAAMLPLALYKTITVFGYRRAAAALRDRPGQPLLLLRVFGFGRRTGRLADLLAARWRHIGPVRLIAAPDLAGRVVAPRTFFAFLRGHLAALFIRDPAGLERRFAVLDSARDPDAGFRIEDVFCSGQAWRDAVRRLMVDASVVVMDLRSFRPGKEGCTFELQALLDLVPLARILLLVDRTTDLEFLRMTLARQWQALCAASPNRRAPGPSVRLLDVTASDVGAIERLIREVVGAASEPNTLDARPTIA